MKTSFLNESVNQKENTEQVFSNSFRNTLIAVEVIVAVIFFLLFATTSHAQINNEVNRVLECIDYSQIDTTVMVPTVYEPVCGCNGKTYPNKYIAQFRHGVTRWDQGVCGSNCRIELNINEFDYNCMGATFCAEITGGTPPFRAYLRSRDNAFKEVLQNYVCFDELQAGDYELIVKDSEQCEASAFFMVPVVKRILEAEIKNVNCFRGQDGAIDLIVPIDIPLNFEWRGPDGFSADTEDIDMLSAGDYKVKVSLANGTCYTSAVFTVEQPRDLQIEFIRVGDRCNKPAEGCLIVAGGTAPYKLWVFRSPNPVNVLPDPVFDANGRPVVDGITATNDIVFDPSPNFDKYCARDIPAGIYYILVVDANRCWEFHKVQILPQTSIEIEGKVKNVSCHSGSDGAIRLEIEGGTPPYVAYWENEAGETGREFQGLTAGVYKVTVFDANQCTASARFEIGQPRELKAEFVITSERCDAGVDGCLIVAGGTAPYRLWAFRCTTPNEVPSAPVFSANGTVVVDNMTATTDLTFDASTNNFERRCAQNIPAGTYYVLIADEHNCWTFLKVVIPNVSGITLEGEVKDVSCHGGSDGAIRLEIEGGTPPYEAYWENEAGETGREFQGLTAGVYKVTVFDANQCMASARFEIGQPRELKAEFVITSERCDAGVDGCLIVAGGTAPYRLWAFRCTTPNEVPSTPVFSANGTVVVDNMTATTDLTFDASTNNFERRCAQNIPAGIYYVLIADEHNCWTFLKVVIPNVSGITLEGEVKAVSCHGGSDGAIRLEIEGGTPPYEAYWENEAGETGREFHGLTAGVYKVTVFDANQCTASARFEIGQPRELKAEFVITSERCDAGVDGCLIVAGGTAPYRLWAFRCTTPNEVPSAPVFSANGTVVVDNMTATTDLTFDASTNNFARRCAQNIPAGIYYVLIADEHNCWTFLKVVIPNVSGITLEGEVKAVSCHGGSDGAIRLEIEGGTPPYEAYWENEAGETGREFQGLTAGVYKVTVFDANQCTASARFEIGQPRELKAEFEVISQSCGEGTDGCLYIHGGTAPYRLWVFTCPDPGTVPTAPVYDANGEPAVDGMIRNEEVDFEPNTLPGDHICARNIPAGTYYVLVADSNNCWTFERIIIEDLPGLELHFEYNGFGEFACVDPLNGTAPYEIIWTNLDSGNKVDSDERFCVYDLRPGVYMVEVTDANGCSASEIFFVEASDCFGGEAIVDPGEIRSGERTTFALVNYNGSRIQWQFKTERTDWLNIPGANSDLYQTPAINAIKDKVIIVRAVVSCNDGTAVLSSPARLLVHGNPNLDANMVSDDRSLFSGSTPVETLPVRVQDNELANVYPTVSEGNVSIRLNADTDQTTIRVMDFSGNTYKLIRSSSYGKGETQELDFSGIPSGMYLVKIETPDSQCTRRVILQRK